LPSVAARHSGGRPCCIPRLCGAVLFPGMQYGPALVHPLICAILLVALIPSTTCRSPPRLHFLMLSTVVDVLRGSDLCGLVPIICGKDESEIRAKYAHRPLCSRYAETIYRQQKNSRKFVRWSSAEKYAQLKIPCVRVHTGTLVKGTSVYANAWLKSGP